MTDWDEDDPTIFEGPVPQREIADEQTRPHDTEPGLIAATRPHGEMPTEGQWLGGCTACLQAAAVDVRRAIIAEGNAQGANPGWGEVFAEAVLRRAGLIR